MNVAINSGIMSLPIRCGTVWLVHIITRQTEHINAERRENRTGEETVPSVMVPVEFLYQPNSVLVT